MAAVLRAQALNVAPYDTAMALDRVELVLRFGPTRLHVMCDTPAPLEWLREFVSPWFKDGAAPPPAARSTRITLDLAAAAWRALRSDAPVSPAARATCFVLEGCILSYPVWTDDQRGRWIFDEDMEVFYGRSPGGSEVTVLAEADGPGARVALMRVCRELAMVEAREAGALLVHCSGVVRDGRAVVISGPKRAGKTSLLLHALQAENAAFLANDRAAISLDERGDWTARGIPTVVALRSATIRLFPALAERLRTSSYSHPQTIEEVRRAPERQPWGAADNGADLSPRQLCDLLGRPATPEATLSVLLFPRVDPGVDGIEMCDLSPSEALRRLDAGLLAAGQTDERPDAFMDGRTTQGPAGDFARARAEACRSLVDQVPCREVLLGRGAFSEDPAAERLWQALG